MNTASLYSVILHDGLRINRYKKSKNIPLFSTNENKGAVFAFRNKEVMTKGIGFIMTSLESVLDNAENITHWTPNVFRYGTYADKNRTFVAGHNEENLRQINTFIVDLDDKIDVGSFLLSCNDLLGCMPTLVLETTRGYQAYFVLEDAVYLTSKTDFKVLQVAKTISSNIRDKLNISYNVDILCNHFGVARFPNKHNVVFMDMDNVRSFRSWINWSMKQSEPIKSTTPLKLIKGKRQIDEPWFNLLLTQSKIKGNHSVYGRNNVAFTLALACYSSGVPDEYCINTLLQFNGLLEQPLRDNEILRIIKSAYSGRYDAANRKYIINLCQTWVDPNLNSSDLYRYHYGWYKFKKDRQYRERSHLFEWKNDLIKYIHANSKNGVLITSRTKIEHDLRIPKSSMTKLLKNIKTSNHFLFRATKGRNATIKLALVEDIIPIISKLKGKYRTDLTKYLIAVFDLKEFNTKIIIQPNIIQCKLELNTS